MAGLIQISGTKSNTWYAFIWDSTGQIWNGSSFVTYSIGSWATYVVSLSENSGSGHYTATFPAGITTAGRYHITVYQMETASPTILDPVVGVFDIDWNGSSIEQGVGSVFKNQTLTELSIGIPPSSPTIEQALMLLYMALRNKQVTTTSETKLYNDAGSVLTKAVLTYDGVTTLTREEFGAP